MTSYRPDYFLILLTILGSVAGVAELIRNPKIRFSKVKTTYSILIALITICLSVVAACLIENRWDFGYIISILFLKKISFIGFAHAGILVSLSYILIVLSVVNLLLGSRSNNSEEESQHYKSTPIIDRKADRKVYVNARMSPEFSYVVEYGIPVILFMILPLAVFYYFVAYLISTHFEFTHIVYVGLILSCLVLTLDTILYFILRKNWVKEITISNSGLSLVGFFKRINASWTEVLSVQVDSSSFSKRVKVITKNGNFSFPLTMKEKEAEYPKIDLLQEQWIEANDTRKPINVDNCVLFNEIKSHLHTA